jgi:HIRAN domain
VVVGVAFEERYWYPDDGGQVWVAGYHVVDPATGRYVGRDDPFLAERGLRVVHVAGAAQHHAEALASGESAPGSELRLRRDPDNPHDPHAIAVETRGGLQLGFVPRAVAEELAPQLDRGKMWSAVVLRERRASPRDPRTGLTMLLAPASAIELRSA